MAASPSGRLRIRRHLDTGFDEVDVNRIGPDQIGFLRFFDGEVRPRP
jgi:hypothetical protein